MKIPWIKTPCTRTKEKNGNEWNAENGKESFSTKTRAAYFSHWLKSKVCVRYWMLGYESQHLFLLPVCTIEISFDILLILHKDGFFCSVSLTPPPCLGCNRFVTNSLNVLRYFFASIAHAECFWAIGIPFGTCVWFGSMGTYGFTSISLTHRRYAPSMDSLFYFYWNWSKFTWHTIFPYIWEIVSVCPCLDRFHNDF